MLYHSTTLFILEKIKEYYLDAVNQKNLEYTSFKELSMPPPKNESFSLLKGGKDTYFYIQTFMECFEKNYDDVFTYNVRNKFKVEISKNIFRNHTVSFKKNKFISKVLKNNRNLYIFYIVDCIKYPQEIWKYNDGKNKMNFLSRYANGIEVIAVFEEHKLCFTGVSAYQAKYPNYLEKQRVGNRIYVKI